MSTIPNCTTFSGSVRCIRCIIRGSPSPPTVPPGVVLSSTERDQQRATGSEQPKKKDRAVSTQTLTYSHVQHLRMRVLRPDWPYQPPPDTQIDSASSSMSWSSSTTKDEQQQQHILCWSLCQALWRHLNNMCAPAGTWKHCLLTLVNLL